MANFDFYIDETCIKEAITWFYKEKLGRSVGVTLNKKKARKNKKSRYEPVIDFSIIDTISLGAVQTITINTIDSTTLKTILTAYIAQVGHLVKDVVVNSYIDRKMRKNNVFFENIQVLCEAYAEQEELDLATDLSEIDISKLNNESIVFNFQEIYKLIEEYYKEFKGTNVEIKYIPQRRKQGYSFLKKEKGTVADEEIEFTYLKEIDDSMDDHYFIVRKYNIIKPTSQDKPFYVHKVDYRDFNNKEYITEEKFQSMMAELFRKYGYELNSISMSKILSTSEFIDKLSSIIRLYVNVTKKPDELTLEDEDDYFEELRKEKPRKLSYGQKMKNFFGSLKRR